MTKSARRLQLSCARRCCEIFHIVCVHVCDLWKRHKGGTHKVNLLHLKWLHNITRPRVIWCLLWEDDKYVIMYWTICVLMLSQNRPVANLIFSIPKVSCNERFSFHLCCSLWSAFIKIKIITNFIHIFYRFRWKKPSAFLSSSLGPQISGFPSENALLDC